MSSWLFAGLPGGWPHLKPYATITTSLPFLCVVPLPKIFFFFKPRSCLLMRVAMLHIPNYLSQDGSVAFICRKNDRLPPKYLNPNEGVLLTG